MQTNFWSRVAKQRISGRRAMAATGGMGLGAAFLIACGGSDNNDNNNGGGNASGGSGSGGGQNGLIAKTSDTFSQAKRGGVLKDYAQAEPRSLDPVNPLADYNRIAPFVYSTLLAAKPGHLGLPAGDLQGQLAQSWETSPDGLQLTMKLQPGVKWHNRPPVNGRALTTDDVLFSLNRYASQGPLSSLVFNSASPGDARAQCDCARFQYDSAQAQGPHRLQHDLTEAKKLMSAAGVGNGFDVTVRYPEPPSTTWRSRHSRSWASCRNSASG